MGKQRTKPVQMTTTTGEKVEVHVPTGSMDKPTPEVDALAKSLMDKTNWKMPTQKYRTKDKGEAENLAYAFSWYLGGYELVQEGDEYVVSSLGYYHYVGA